MQVLFLAMLVNALHSTLEDRKEALKTVNVNGALEKGDFEGSLPPRSESLVREELFHFLSISFAILYVGTPITLLRHAQSMTPGVIIPFQVGATLCTKGIILSTFVAGYEASCYDPPNGSAT
ncbi:MAG: hypothetical protein ACLP5H_02390 [Desulfomonilaceae bacterium]